MTVTKKVTRHEYRCECKTKPLLAIYGRNSQGRAYVYLASYRNKKPWIKIHTVDPISIWCRICDRWWLIEVKNEGMSAEERRKPPEVPEEKTHSRVLLDNPSTAK